jgi:hypothetical protein
MARKRALPRTGMQEDQVPANPGVTAFRSGKRRHLTWTTSGRSEVMM